MYTSIQQGCIKLLKSNSKEDLQSYKKYINNKNIIH